ncbi:MAG: type II toxin-antitoxin system PemK/MazF family toxin [archaeon]|nr:type II toxin-antitoxin system PemK/MazF family toxin [archaeon]
METLVKGDIVVLPFPFSDFSSSKKRPAVVLCTLKGNDFIFCQITSQNFDDDYSIKLVEKDFKSGTLKQESNIRPNKLFTGDRLSVLYKIGAIKKEKIDEIIEKTCKILKD